MVHFINPTIYIAYTILSIILVLNTFYLHSNPQKESPTQNYLPLYAPVSNSFFIRQQEITEFYYNNTEKLASLEGQIAELPHSFGFSFEEGNKIFPPYIYPSCKEVEGPTPENVWINLDYQTNLLTMSCPSNTTSKYVLGPPNNIGRFINIENSWDHWPVRTYKGPVKIGKSEDLAIGLCEGSNYRSFFHEPRYNEKVHQKALENYEKNSVVKQEKPMIILMIGIDSFSRNMFYRKLNETLAYLNKLNEEEDWTVFDFMIHNIQGTGTAQNVLMTFGTQNSLNNEIFTNPVGKQAIWNILKKRGFVTMFGFETCSERLNRALGTDPPVDHIVNPFYCGLARTIKFSWHKRTKEQRCVGDQMSSWYMMNYTKAFSKLYPGVNQWIYNHYDNCHEITGEHGQTLDFDLKDYVKTYIEEFSENFEVVVYLVADHGMRFGNFNRNEFAVEEHKLPAFFLVARTAFLEKIPYSFSSLTHNTKRITTKGDLRESMIWLGNWQNGLEHKKFREYVNLFEERASNWRNCEDIEIEFWYCSGLELKPYNVPLKRDFEGLSEEDKFTQSVIFQVGNYMINHINLKGYMDKHAQKGVFCEFLELGEIFNIKIAKRSKTAMLFNLNISIKNRESVIFEGLAIVAGENGSINYVFLPDPFVVEDLKLLIEIEDIGRVDPYAGPCETISLMENLNPIYCVCTDYAYETHKEVFNNK